MSTDFYRAFEDKFRGSRETIRSRLLIYRPLLEGLVTHASSREAIDLGCGRGEWLECLQDLGFACKGVDLDAGMLQACRAIDLPVQEQDALAALRILPSESMALVSAFHLVEHMPFDQVLELIQESHRVLVPGGLLMMETPNSENLGVGTWNFYLDPTHQRPIPHLLLEFSAQFGGFEFTRIMRVNEDKQLASQQEPGLFDVLCRVSPDYAVIAMKARIDAKTVEDVFGDFLSKPHGITLERLANQYDDKYSGAIRTLDADLFALRADLTSVRQAEEKFLQQFMNDEESESGLSLEKFARTHRAIASRLDRLEQTIELQTVQFQAIQTQLGSALEAIHTSSHQQAALTEQLQQVYQSRSWRLTKPIRLLSLVVGRLKQTFTRRR